MSCRCQTCLGIGEENIALMGQAGKTISLESLQCGRRLYHGFNGVAPAQVVTVHHPRIIPPVVVELGELVGLMYRSEKGQPGRPQTYIHRMEDPPRLVSNIEGTQLYIVGGSYQVTARGIEG